MRFHSSLGVALLCLSACSSAPIQPEVQEPESTPKTVDLAVSSATPLPEPTVNKPLDAPPPPEPSITPVLTYTGGFATPESVLYDEAGDRYLVSNINGGPSAIDGNGYILELSPDGRVTNPKLIAGGMNKVRLDAPKGLAIVGTELWVADITVVRRFDLKTAAHKGDIQLPNTTFANDIVAAPDGGAYVSDSAVKFGDAGLEASGTDQVFFIDKANKVKVFAKDKELAGPNGLAIGVGNILIVNSIKGDEIYQLTDKGKRDIVTKAPGGQLDGLLAVGDQLVVSSWKAESVYRGPLGGKLEPILTKVKGVADIGYDSKRKRLLVPRFLDDKVEVYDLK